MKSPFKGVNALCRQCIKDCKQFENVKVIKCGFMSSQKKATQNTPPPCKAEKTPKQAPTARSTTVNSRVRVDGQVALKTPILMQGGQNDR